jgi:hypothetical protein
MKSFAEAKQAWSVEKSICGYWFPTAWKRSSRLLDIFNRFQVPFGAAITEFGVGGQRNLVALFEAGYKTVSGYDITSQLDILRLPKFAVIVIDDDPHKMPECDMCLTMACLQHVTDEQLDTVISAIATRTRQMILTCEDERSERSGQWPHDYITLFKEKGWQHVWWMPASSEDGLDGSYVWRMFLNAPS